MGEGGEEEEGGREGGFMGGAWDDVERGCEGRREEKRDWRGMRAEEGREGGEGGGWEGDLRRRSSSS